MKNPIVRSDAAAFVNPGFGDGLTKREYFAAAALKGLLACPDVNGTAPELGRIAVKFSEELIAALNAND